MAVGILIYVSIYYCQRIFNFLIYERFFNNSLQNFTDVSSIANISVLILLMDSYGFYIHGRSPHGFSDTDMLSMILQFKREEENLCGHRGLIVGNEHQTFSILAPKNLRTFTKSSFSRFTTAKTAAITNTAVLMASRSLRIILRKLLLLITI